jgi:hypothetical protein
MSEYFMDFLSLGSLHTGVFNDGLSTREGVKVLFLKRLIPKWLRFAAANLVNQVHPRLLVRSPHWPVW